MLSKAVATSHPWPFILITMKWRFRSLANQRPSEGSAGCTAVAAPWAAASIAHHAEAWGPALAGDFWLVHPEFVSSFCMLLCFLQKCIEIYDVNNKILQALTPSEIYILRQWLVKLIYNKNLKITQVLFNTEMTNQTGSIVLGWWRWKLR